MAQPTEGAMGVDVATQRTETLLRVRVNICPISPCCTPEALELLIKVAGADRVLFATECPGTVRRSIRHRPPDGRHGASIR